MTEMLSDWGEWLPELVNGLGTSVLLTVLALAGGFPLGLVLAQCVMSPWKLLKAPAIALAEVGRGTPVLVILYFFYFGLPNAGITLESFTAATCGLIVTVAGYSSELFRAGLQAVPHGEIEAAQALGMGRVSILRRITVPQGLRIAIPPLLGLSIQVFQATALAFSIALPELMSSAYAIGALTFKYFSVLSLAACCYLAITIPASWLVHYLERRMSVHLNV
jgi:polar amino acid transport system permease protein